MHESLIIKTLIRSNGPAERGYWRGTELAAKGCNMGEISFWQARCLGLSLPRSLGRLQMGKVKPASYSGMFTVVNFQAVTLRSVTLLRNNELL